jgi:murein DD-endopeptidase MepM/ murein hydrolase activator NlpD
MVFARSHRLLSGAFLIALLAVILLPLSGCSLGGNKEAKAPTATPTSSSDVTATPTLPTGDATIIPPLDTPTAEASPESTPVPAPQIQLSSTVIGQGETTTLYLWNYFANSAAAFLDGRQYPLIADGDSFWGIVGAAGDADPGEHTITIDLYDVNGSVIGELATSVTVSDMGYLVENIDLPPEVNSALDPTAVQQETDARNAALAEFTPQKLWSGPFIWPVPSDVIVDPFGIRRSYNGGPVSSFHMGIDIAVDEGVPIAAAASGRVAYVGFGPTHGNCILIDHGAGVFSGYSHMSQVNVQLGQMVNQGDTIGLVGSTGMATGPHLHWEIDVRGLPVNPVQWTLEDLSP